MRPGEIDHVNYHFITQAEFDRMVAQNEFLEHATYAAHSYGTPAAPILAQLEAGRDVLLDIEVQGALQVKRSYPDAVLIFIAAPSFGELEHRLRAGATRRRTPSACAYRQPAGSMSRQIATIISSPTTISTAVSKSFWRS